MASRSFKRMRLSRKFAAKSRNSFKSITMASASISGIKFSPKDEERFRSKFRSKNGIALSQEYEAFDFKPRGEPDTLHLVVSGWVVPNRGHRLFVNLGSGPEWSDQAIMWSPFPNEVPGLIGSCNGLLCLQSSKCVVWEPSTNKLQLIPRHGSMTRPCFCAETDCVRFASGRGGNLFFDSHNRDYKLFRFIRASYYYKDDEDGFSNFPHYSFETVEVYSLKNNVWKELSYPHTEVEGVNHPIIGSGKGVCVDGVCYWLGECSGEYSFILSYNFVTEEFSSFRIPDIPELICPQIVEMDGSLCLLYYPCKEGKIRLRKASSSSLSSSLQPEWSDVDGFEVDVGPHELPLWFGKRNGVYKLLLEGPNGNLREYDYDKKMFTDIPVRTSPAAKDNYEHDSCYYSAFAYEAKAKNSVDIWHSSSFHVVERKERFAILAGECDQNPIAAYACGLEEQYC